MDTIYIIDKSVDRIRTMSKYMQFDFSILEYRFKYHIARKALMYVNIYADSFISLAIRIFRNVSENNTVYCFSLCYPIHKCEQETFQFPQYI